MMIAVGVDTHKHQHLAVAVDALGQLLAEITITATLAGYRELLAWLAALEGEIRVGIEGAGSYGAGLCEYLQDNSITVFEVERPRRRERRTGKSDRLDALLAAKKVLGDDGLSTPRGHGKRLALQMRSSLTAPSSASAHDSITSCRPSTSEHQRRSGKGSGPRRTARNSHNDSPGCGLARTRACKRTPPSKYSATSPTAPARSTSKPRTTPVRSTRSRASLHPR